MISTGWSFIPDNLKTLCFYQRRHALIFWFVDYNWQCFTVKSFIFVWGYLFYYMRNIQQKKLLHCLEWHARSGNLNCWVCINCSKCSETEPDVWNWEIITIYQHGNLGRNTAQARLTFYTSFFTHHPLLGIRSDCSTLPEKLKNLISLVHSLLDMQNDRRMWTLANNTGAERSWFCMFVMYKGAFIMETDTFLFYIYLLN